MTDTAEAAARAISIGGRREIAEAALRDILRAHGMGMQHLRSKCTWREYVKVRIEAAQKLNAMGFKRSEIARVLGRDQSTVAYYLMTPSERRQDNRVRLDLYYRQKTGAR